MNLTLKQQRFIENYANPASETYANATRSYIKAGYKETPNVMQSACRCLNNVKVSKAISEYRAENANKKAVTRDYLIEKMQLIIESTDSNNADIVRSASLIADMCGFKRENAPNAEKELARAKKTKEEEQAILELAKTRVKDLSQYPKISKVKELG